MTESRFDGWTRRRFGLATGGAVAANLGLTAFDAMAGRRKKRKKRCRRLHQVCRQVDGTEKRCCKPLTCTDETETVGEAACCRFFRTPCASDGQCCGTFKCRKVIGLSGNRCCASFDAGGCRNDRDCCAGDGVTCAGAVCCRRIRSVCVASDECCGDLLCASAPNLGGGLHCCSGHQGPCTASPDCCGELLCSAEGVCA